MNTTPLANREETLVARDAADWIRRLQQDDPAERTAFLAWLRQSPLHVRELLLALSLDEALEGMDARRQIDLESLVASVSGNVVPLHESTASRDIPIRRRAVAWIAAAASLAAALALVLIDPSWAPWSFLSRGPTYVTKLGEQRGVPLADGSVVFLNTQSRVREKYSSTARDVYLIEGQAIFQVKHDAARPFRVHTADAVVRAVGTKFDVHRFDGSTQIAVIEGVVEVAAGNSGAAGGASPQSTVVPQKLAAGEAISVDARSGVVAAPEPVDVDDITAWQQRRLVFRKETLANMAAEFNRYNRVKIRLEGAEVSDRRLSGTFQVDGTELLIRFLEQDRSLAVERHSEEIVIRARTAH